MERITKNKAGKAAWPSSQALFDALRKACELEVDIKELRDARDTIKNVHNTIDRPAFGGACGSVCTYILATRIG